MADTLKTPFSKESKYPKKKVKLGVDLNYRHLNNTSREFVVLDRLEEAGFRDYFIFKSFIKVNKYTYACMYLMRWGTRPSPFRKRHIRY
jgi:hypothetical protein